MATFSLTTAADLVEGTADDDLIVVPPSNTNLAADDTIIGGAGFDTLRFDRSLALSVSSLNLAGLSGIEEFDLRAAPSVVMSLDDAVLAQAQDATVRLSFGSGSVMLDLRSVTSPDAGTVLLNGTGQVDLFNAGLQRVVVANGVNGSVSGGTGRDLLEGGNGRDQLRGNDGDDVLSGGRGNDTLSGGAGQDRLSGGADNDQMDGGAGHDLISGGVGSTRATGGAGADTYVLSPGEQLTVTDFEAANPYERIDLRAFAGLTFADLGLAQTGLDLLVSLPDGSTITLTGISRAAVSAASFVFAGDAVATMAEALSAPADFSFTDAADRFTGGAGNDIFELSGTFAKLDGVDIFDGGAGIDTLRIWGEDRNIASSRLAGMTSVEVIDLTGATGVSGLSLGPRALEGSETGFLLVRHGASPLLLDTERFASADQVVVEGTGTVTLRDVPGQKVTISDSIAGHVRAGNDPSLIQGGALGDTIEGNEREDTLSGGGGDDVITGGESNDLISGGSGNDRLSGDDGNDTMVSSGGNDTLTGGQGSDVFVIGRAAGTTTLADYDRDNLVERVDLTGFSDLTSRADLTFTNQGDNVRVTADGLSLVFLNTQASDLDDGDFLFAGENPLVFNVDPSIAMADLQQLLDGAPPGATINLAAGVYSITETLRISRSDISLVGAGEGQTIFRSDVSPDTPGPTLKVEPTDMQIRLGVIPEDIALGSRTVTLPDSHEFAVGDLLYVTQPNDAEWLAETGNAGWEPPVNPEDQVRDGEDYYLREFRSRIVSIENNVATLAEPSPYAFEAGVALLAESTFLSNVNLSHFTIEGIWGNSDPFNFEVTLDAWEGRSTLEMDGVRDSHLQNISIIEPASHAFRFQRIYDVTGDSLTGVGAHNKAGGNGYHFMLYEAFSNDFTNLSSTDARHAVLFTSYSAEHYNNIHLLFSNRDINFHGSPDADNTVVVDVMRQDYPAGSTPQFDAVQGGSFPLHPYWTIEANDVTFRDAITGERNDIIHAHEDGGFLSTGLGNDRLYGGSGNDTLDGGENGDILTGGGGRDQFLRQFNDFTDTITDFETGSGGDVMVLIGTGYRAFSELVFEQEGSDTLLWYGTTGLTRFMNTRVEDFTAANFRLENDVLAGQTFSLRANEMFGLGTNRHDLFNITAFHLADPALKIIAGAGLDTVAIATQSLTGDLFAAGIFSGVEVFDVSGVRFGNFSISAQLAAQSDTQRLTLAVGDTGNKLLLNVLPLGRGRTVSIDGAREVELTGGISHTVKSTDRVGTNITGDVLNDILWGGRASDYLNGGSGNDTILATGGDDTIDGGAGADIMNGGPGSDTYIIDNLGDRVAESRRWDGVDHVISSVDFLMGRDHIENLTLTGTGNTRGIGNGLENVIIGNDGDNIIDGGPRADRLVGGLGDDTYFVRAVGDTIIELAGEGTDTVKALFSFALPDQVENLHLLTSVGINGFGNDMNNVIIGNNFNNLIDGMGGNDTLSGQGGADTFRFLTAPGPGNVDRITDFAPGEDRIMLLGSNLGGLPRGALSADAFVLGTAAQDAEDVILYDRGTGRLWVDVDGTGDAAPVLFAVLEGRPDLGADDFILA